uniref:Uncharacterized protein n=1 Tax=Ascaris lumbricoides TaxID=6252 RepID=A0A0M3IAL0_ASCLU
MKYSFPIFFNDAERQQHESIDGTIVFKNIQVIRKKRELGRISDMDPSLRSWGNRHFPSNENEQQRDGPYERVGDLRSGQQLQQNCDDNGIHQLRKTSPEKVSLGGLINGGLSSTVCFSRNAMIHC